MYLPLSAAMRTSHTLLVLALAFTGLTPLARAQLQTYDTRPFYAGDVITFAAGASKGEVFTNVSAVKSLEYNFFAGSQGNNQSTNLTAVFGEWNGSSIVAGTSVSFGTINIPAASGGQWSSTLANNGGAFPNFSYSFDLSSISSGLIDPTYGYLTDPTKSYIMLLTNTSGTNTGLGLGEIDSSGTDAFAYGYEKGTSDRDWTFAQIVVAPGNQNLGITPIPESSTVAAIVGAVFIFGLIGLRLRQRQLVAVPITVA